MTPRTFIAARRVEAIQVRIGPTAESEGMLMGLGHPSATGPTEPVTLYSPQQLADMLGVGLGWVRRRTQNRTLPHVKVGRKVWFTEDHVRTIVHQLTVEPVSREQARRGSARSLL